MSAIDSDKLMALDRLRKAVGPGWRVVTNGTRTNQGLAARVWNHLSVLRVPDTLMAGFGAVIGAQLADIPWQSSTTVLPVVGSLMALSGASMVFNDWRDLASDRINNCQRSLASGRVSRPAALRMALSLFALAIALAFFSDPTIGILATAIAGASIMYSLGLKSIPLLGNVVVGVAAASPFWIWIPLAPAPDSNFLILTLSLMLLNTGREIARTAEDMPGDRACGVDTVATRFGSLMSARLAAALAAAGLLLCWVPWWNGSGSWFYFAAIAFSTLLGLTILFRIRLQPGLLRAVISARYCKAVTLIMAAGCFWGIVGPV